MIKLYKLEIDCGRAGCLYGLFVAKEEDVKDIIGKDVYFGEVLGKYSEVFEPMEEEEIIEISSNQGLINELVSLFDSNTISGYNPFDYIEEE